MVGLLIYSVLLYPALWLMLVLPTTALGNPPSDPTEPFIEVELEPKTAYVQSMVRYSIRLYRNSHLQRGYFLDQEIPNTVKELSHDTSPRYVNRAGQEYELLERHYLLFPQRSGNITLPPAIFSSHNLFVQGKPVTLEVKPRLGSDSGPWLPAKDLQLHETIDLPEDGIHSGMQIRRTITIKASGLTGAQLPTLSSPKINGMEIQDLASEVEQKIIGGMMLGQRHIRQLLIPKHGGQFTLPEISIRWWNTTSKSHQTASLPATTISVLDSPKPQIQSPMVSPQPTLPQSEETRIEPGPMPEAIANLGLLALLLSLITYGLLIWHYRLFTRLQQQLQISTCIRGFKAACKANDPAATAGALLRWGDLVLGSYAPVSILGFRKQFTDAISQETLQKLDRAIYTTADQNWSGKVMLDSVVPLMKSWNRQQLKIRVDALPRFYS